MIKNILALGNPVYDIIETPVLTRKDRLLSGCSTNACLVAVKLNERACLVGTVGADWRDKLQADLACWKIDAYLYPSQQTGGFHLVYDDRGNRQLFILGIADQLPVILDGYKSYDFILIGPILGEVTPELVKVVKEKVRAPVLLDPQGLLRTYSSGKITHELTAEFKAVARMSDIIKANELETQVITGIDPRQQPEQAVKALYDYGGRIAITTLAEAGSIIFDGQQFIRIPPFTTEAIDPTGAGDTYAAGFIIGYLENPYDLRAAGCFASAVASVMVENSGPEFPLTRHEAERRTQILMRSPQELKL